jgi:hypothetical protein
MRSRLRGLRCAARAAQRSHLAPLLICSARLQRLAELVRYPLCWSDKKGQLAPLGSAPHGMPEAGPGLGVQAV